MGLLFRLLVGLATAHKNYRKTNKFKTMKLFTILTTVVLALTSLISSCHGQEESEQHSDHLTELLDTMLQHRKVEVETGVHVGQEDAFLTARHKKNSDFLLLIANSRDENDIPLPLGWQEVGNYLSEPILSSHTAHDDLPVWQLRLGCFVAVVGLCFLVAASTPSSNMLRVYLLQSTRKNNDENEESMLLPTHNGAETTTRPTTTSSTSRRCLPVRTLSNNMMAVLEIGSQKARLVRRPSLNLSLA
jgi:hypothetical protein